MSFNQISWVGAVDRIGIFASTIVLFTVFRSLAYGRWDSHSFSEELSLATAFRRTGSGFTPVARVHLGANNSENSEILCVL
jgi:hypothetical protein